MLKISKVAYKIGFDDASYFVMFFKRNLGYSPKDYRNNSLPRLSKFDYRCGFNIVE